jgi:aspartate-semialdehyde dehydrogenase
MGGYLRRNMSANVVAVITPAVRPLADRIAMQRLAVETLLAASAEPQGYTEAHSK